MIKPNKVKPLSKHKDICMKVGIDPSLIHNVIKAYYNKLADGLVIQTIQTVTLLCIAAVGILIILIMLSRMLTLLSWWTMLTIALVVLTLVIFGTIDNTANARIARILKKIQENGEANLKCFALVIKKHYVKGKDTYILEVDYRNKILEIKVEDFVYDLCVSGSKLLLFSYGDDVLFWCPIKFLEEFMQGSEPGTRKIQFSDIKEYYSIVFHRWIKQLREMFKEARDHYSKCIDDLKKRK